MAAIKRSTKAMDLTPEEREVLAMYREMAQWEKNAVNVLFRSIVWGKLEPEKTNDWSWRQMSRSMGIKGAHHG